MENWVKDHKIELLNVLRCTNLMQEGIIEMLACDWSNNDQRFVAINKFTLAEKQLDEALEKLEK